MTQFNEGQEVEVLTDPAFPRGTFAWRKAKIVAPTMHTHRELYTVQFPDNSRAVFDAAHIRSTPFWSTP